MGADLPRLTRSKPDSAEIDWTISIQKGANSVKMNRSSPTQRNANADKGQPNREAIGGHRSGSRQGLTWPNRRSTRKIHNTQLKPVSARSGQESNRRTHTMDERRVVGSTTCSGNLLQSTGEEGVSAEYGGSGGYGGSVGKIGDASSGR